MRRWSLLFCLAAACGGPAPITVTSDHLVLTLHRDAGTFDLAADGHVVFRDATAEIALADMSILSLRDCTPTYASLGMQTTPLGNATRSRLGCDRDGVGLELELDLYADRLTLLLTATNDRPASVTVGKLTPMFVDAQAGGALFIGADPARHNILENGGNIGLDNAAAVRAGNTEPFPLAAAIPGNLRGNSISNWNHVVTDLDGHATLAAGWLSFQRAVPTVGITYEAGRAVVDAGRKSFTTYAAENVLLWNGKPVAPGASLASELFYLDPITVDPLDAIERYADAVTASLAITQWTHRDGGRITPNGWNSWTGSSSTGGYGSGVPFATWQQNLAVAHDQIQPFGLTWFQYDGGWEQALGDWNEDTSVLPDGLPAVVAADAADGLKPGVWIAPFWVSDTSQLAADHPDWLAPAAPGIIAAAVPTKTHTLDLSNPDALAHVTSTIARLHGQGMQWIKSDFTYYDLLGVPTADPTLTNVEAYRAGMKAIRAGMGADDFLLGVAVMGLNYDLVDGMRITLDNQPSFEPSMGEDLLLYNDQGFKPTVRTGARRYYLDRIWVNHDDLLFFRADSRPSVPPLTLDESIDFATFVGLTGGIVKMGDRLVDLTPPQVDVIRKLLPAYGVTGRPLDLFTREYPEMWHLPVTGPSGAWDLIGVTHWGHNWDLTQRPIADVADEDRSYHFDLAALGMDASATYLAYEFWSETALGAITGALDVPVQKHHASCVALRKQTGAPQLLGTNRHLTQGATDVTSESYDAALSTFTLRFSGAAGTTVMPFDYHIAVAAAGHATAPTAHVTSVDDTQVMVTLSNDVVDVRFRLSASADTTLTLVF